MAKSYFNYIQPTIVRMSGIEDNPEHLRNKYLVNLNVVGIKYFTDRFLLIDDGEGGYMYLYTEDRNKIAFTNDLFDSGVIDLPRCYLTLTPEFCESQETFSLWIMNCIADPSYFLTGIEGFRPGTDYYFNEVLAKYLLEYEQEALEALPEDISNYTLANYLETSFNLTKNWRELEADEARLTNFDYFRGRNGAEDLTYSEEELLDFNHTFWTIIDENAEPSEDDMMKVTNQIYRRVIDYFLNYQSDCTLTGLELILNSSTTNTSIDGVSSSGCGCSSGNSSSSSDPTSNMSCVDIYKNAMLEWLKKMLSDVNFWKDWFYFTDPDGNTYPNEGALDQLEQLIEDLLSTDNNLGTNKGEKNIYSHCICGSTKSKGSGSGNGGSGNGNNNGDGTGSDSDIRDALEQFDMLLEWVKNGCIDNNANKIRVIGERFATLLPNMNWA